MIVPAMSIAEIRKEVFTDLPIIVRKAGYVAKGMWKRYSPKRDEMVVQVFDYFSKFKNKWFYRISLTKDIVYTAFAVYYDGKKGMNVIMPTNKQDELFYFTSHFLNRYNERRRLGLVHPADVARTLMKDLGHLEVQRLEKISPLYQKIFCVFESGTVLGTEDVNEKFFYMNTFLPNDMLKGDQKEKFDQLNSEIERNSPFVGLVDD